MIHSCRRSVLAAALATAAIGLAGCPVTAWLTAIAAPKKTVQPVFACPKGKNILVFLDDRYNRVTYPAVLGEFTRQLNQQLLDHKVAAEVVDYERLTALMSANPDFYWTPIGTVGRKLGADLVLYVQVEQFSLKDKDAGELWRGQFEVSARMIDVNQGRLWPKDKPGGHPVPAIDTPTTAEKASTYADELTKTLAAGMADRVAKLFYEHKVPHAGVWER